MSHQQNTVLDLYSGPGGVGLALAEFGLPHVGVDIEDYGGTYPGPFFQLDASDITTLYEVFQDDTINLLWLSPPCQAYSRLSYVHYDNPKEAHDTFADLNVRSVIKYLDPDEYVIENVVGCDDLQDPTRINGHGVGYEFGLERLFETSFDCPNATENGDSSLNMKNGVGGSYVSVAEAKNVPHTWGQTAVRSAIPKRYTQHILHHCPSISGVDPVPYQAKQQQLPV